MPVAIAIDRTTQSPAFPLKPAACLPPSFTLSFKLLFENNLLKHLSFVYTRCILETSLDQGIRYFLPTILIINL